MKPRRSSAQLLTPSRTLPRSLKRTLPLAVYLGCVLVVPRPVWADITSSASSASSTSVGSSSASIQNSSDSSSRRERVAQRAYTVIDMAELAGQPDMLRVRLHAADTRATPAGGTPHADATAGDRVFLLLPREAAVKAQLAPGMQVIAQHQVYGVAFATRNGTGNGTDTDTGTDTNPSPASGTLKPFFLVLDDAWHHELHSRPVVL